MMNNLTCLCLICYNRILCNESEEVLSPGLYDMFTSCTWNGRQIYLSLTTVYIFALFTSIILTLQTSYCGRIRMTNLGFYLILLCWTALFYSTMALIFFIIDLTQCLQISNFHRQFQTIIKVSSLYQCLWLMSFIACERMLIQCFDTSLYASRKRSIIFSTFSFAFITLTCIIPRTLFYIYHIQLYYEIYRAFSWFHPLLACLLQFIASISVLINIAKRKIYITDQHDTCHIWLQQLSKHRDFFVPILFLLFFGLPWYLAEQLNNQCRQTDPLYAYRVLVALKYLSLIPSLITIETKTMSYTPQRRRKFCPNGFCGICRPPQTQKQIETLVHVKHIVDEKETPYGYVHFYPGVRTTEDKYTCPVLSVHIYRYSQAAADTAQDQRTVLFDYSSKQQTQQGPQKMKTEEQASAEEEVIIIPIEDVTRITFKTEIKKGLQADIETEIIREHKLTENCFDTCCERICCCCEQLKKCCASPVQVAPLVRSDTVIHSVAAKKKIRKTRVKDELLTVPKERCKSFFDCCRCWCCRRNKLVGLFKRTTTVAEEEAQRVVTMTLEYGQYTILDTTSKVRVANGEPQVINSRQQFATTKLEFYLLTNREYDSKHFNEQKQQAEILCRTVIQLKGMTNHYPSDTELDNILGQSHQKVFGNVFEEPVLALEHDLNTENENPQIQESHEQPAIKQQMNITLQRNEQDS
ncbi:hypothetical protein I4U23_022831 [Adineta vaga]|nr:hypothetical protein I4U23_022831 [Adineta vaga]